MRLHRSFVAVLILTLAPAVAAGQDEVSELRGKALKVAEEYATYRWRGSESNVRHGKDSDGVQVDTPDRSFREHGWEPGEWYVGVPYQWGGFSDLK